MFKDRINEIIRNEKQEKEKTDKFYSDRYKSYKSIIEEAIEIVEPQYLERFIKDMYFDLQKYNLALTGISMLQSEVPTEEIKQYIQKEYEDCDNVFYIMCKYSSLAQKHLNYSPYKADRVEKMIYDGLKYIEEGKEQLFLDEIEEQLKSSGIQGVKDYTGSVKDFVSTENKLYSFSEEDKKKIPDDIPELEMIEI